MNKPRFIIFFYFITISVFCLYADDKATENKILTIKNDDEAFVIYEESIDLKRPLRIIEQPIKKLEHHAKETRYKLELPYGDSQFEKFRESFLSSGGKKWLETITERSKPYTSYILEKINSYGMPEELFFLPYIESEYYANAKSRSGALGLWQFMKNSIAGYNISISEWVDERRDFTKSSDAALRKLEYNYTVFGDWLLAIASYNCGVGAMQKAIKNFNATKTESSPIDKNPDFWALRSAGLLPKETASYIPKFLAVVSVAMHGGRNGLKLTWTPTIEWSKINLDKPIDITMLSELTAIPLSILRTGNAELNFNVTPPENKYYLKVPTIYKEIVEDALKSKCLLIKSYLHIVKSGDTISAIARHYEVPISMITKANPGLNPDRIRIDQKIVIPALKDKKPFVSEKTAFDNSINFNATYITQKGDTLWAIALKYNVSVDILAKKNNMDLSDTLASGIKLNVPKLD